MLVALGKLRLEGIELGSYLLVGIYELIVLLGVVQGMRRAEIAGQLRENIDLSGRVMLVHGKGNVERWLPVADQTHEVMSHYLAIIPGAVGPLIRSERHPSRGITADHLGRLVVQWMKDGGIKQHPFDGKSSHALRHTMAGATLDQGADIRDVQAALGHRSLQSTYVYLKRRQATSRLRDVMGQQRYGV